MREIKYIALHCTAGNQRNTAADVVAYHTRPKARDGLGWSKPGYHFIVEADGAVVCVCPIETPSNGVGAAYNPVAINVSWVGGVDTSKPGLPPIDNRTPAQKRALRALVADLKRQFPAAKIQGHRDFPNVKKVCPCFDAIAEYSDL